MEFSRPPVVKLTLKGQAFPEPNQIQRRRMSFILRLGRGKVVASDNSDLKLLP